MALTMGLDVGLYISLCTLGLCNASLLRLRVSGALSIHDDDDDDDDDAWEQL